MSAIDHDDFHGPPYNPAIMSGDVRQALSPKAVVSNLKASSDCTY